MKTPDLEPQKKVTVVIPCHNEAASIAGVISSLPYGRLAQAGIQTKVLVVDNSSSDDTAPVAEAAGAEVIYEPNKGKGNALRTGFRKALQDTDYIVMLDGDNTYSPEEVMRLIEPLRSDFCDVVVGSRLYGHIQTTAMSRLNRLGNRLFTRAVQLLYGANVTDVLTGYFAWKKSALEALEPHIKSSGFAIEMEMITKMARLGHRMAAVPISYHPRAGVSNLRPFKDGCHILAMLVKSLMWRPQRVAAPAIEAEALPPRTETTKSAFVPRKMVFVSDAIYPYMKGGKEKRLHEITKRLAAMGHDVHIYTMKWWPGPDRTLFQDGVYLHALCKRHEMYHGDRRAISEGILFGLACFKLLRVRFDVLDVDHMPFFPIFSAWVVCSLRGRRLYATWHEALSHEEWIGYMGFAGRAAALIERLSIRLPYCITAASLHTKHLLMTMHGRARRVELVASGIDASLLRAVQPTSIHLDVLYVGRLVKDKHIDKLILTIDVLSKSRPEIRCVIIGGGVEKNRLQQQVGRLKLQENVTFLDPLPKEVDVYAYMKAAKVFCSPSVREGFGITVLEALGCGTPVVTVNSTANAAQHLIQDGQNGSIVSLNPAALAEAILRWISLARRPDITPRITDYDWHQLAEKQAEVYTL
jgi:glycosyltransferase involved in cell wall biosynthesis